MWTRKGGCLCIRVYALAAALVAAIAPASAAQTNTGEIAGVIEDASGGVLPGATVVATHPASGAIVERVTDAAGRFVLPALRIGTWDVTVTMPGFAPQTRAGIQIEIGRTFTLDVTLAVQGLEEQVVVQTVIPVLQSTTAEISDVIENREVVQIPLNGRNFLALAQLSDAVVIPPGGTRGDALQQAGPLPNVGGQRSGHNIYLLDGAKITDELFNNLVINPSVDSIQEFRIQKSMYPAEFGGKASALINVATRAGSNAITGSLFEFRRDERFDSPNYFHPKSEPIPPLRQNQFGGALGGPLVRDRSFFFGSYEGQRMRRALTRTFPVPPAEVRSGDFSGVAPVCDPLTIPTTGACAPFPGNRIPAGRIDPIAAALLERVPLPTSAAPVQNLTSIEEQNRDVDQISLRLDHRLGAASQIFGRFSTFDAEEQQPFGAGALEETLVPGFGRTLTTRTRNLVVSHTHVFGATVLNELRAGWMSVTGGQASVNRGIDFAGSAGLLGVTRDPRDVGFPQVSFRGLYSAIGDPTSFVSRDNQHVELYDNVTVDRGAHRFKFGAYYFHLQLRPEQPDNARGAFTYTGQFTGNAFADFLLGYPTSATSGIGRGDENGRANWLHVYAQDDWEARRNLTFNLGLRYEFNQHMYDVNDRLSSVDLSVPGGRFVVAGRTAHPSGQALLPLVPIPYVSAEEIGWGRGLLDPSTVRLAPRTGFALTLNDGRAVVRGGYGIFLNQWAYSVQTAFARNLPFFYTQQVDVPSDVRVPPLRTRDILAGNPTGTVGASIMDYDYNVEYSQTWSGGLQYELLPATMAEVAYMGTWTIGADNATVRNVPEPGSGSIQARRPIPQLSRINAIRFDGRSIYHGVTFKLERRLRGGYAYNVSYTLSSSQDDASSPGPTESEANVPQNVRDIFSETGEWARSSFDHRHLFVASGTYEIPFERGPRWLESALRGWRVNTVVLAQSGAPFTVNLGVDQANIGAGPAQRPDELRDPNLPRGQRTADRWFDTDAFALPAPFAFGSAPRNSVLGPELVTVDLALARTWRAGGSAVVELRWEVFNLLDRANFDVASRLFGTPNFGRIFSAKSPREMQFGVRLAF
ncbi:MAG: carboxypeptidase regulatory-like domain-containing protein [Acidobacteria bacterium]|nr:carboxypeptidase regulatory-like domain-containing protein [Acidobacteriota bacterium]